MQIIHTYRLYIYVCIHSDHTSIEHTHIHTYRTYILASHTCSPHTYMHAYNVYIHACMYVCMHTCMGCMYVWAACMGCMHVCMGSYVLYVWSICMYVYVCMSCMHVCVSCMSCMYMYVCMDVCMDARGGINESDWASKWVSQDLLGGKGGLSQRFDVVVGAGCGVGTRNCQRGRRLQTEDNNHARMRCKAV